MQLPGVKSLGTAGDYVTMFAGWHSGENFPGIAEINAKHEKLSSEDQPIFLLDLPMPACKSWLILLKELAAWTVMQFVMRWLLPT